jgi:hypothetical protein
VECCCVQVRFLWKIKWTFIAVWIGYGGDHVLIFLVIFFPQRWRHSMLTQQLSLCGHC